MFRKIVSQGKGGYTVSLPVNWVRENKLQPGDNIQLDIKEDKIIIGGTGSQIKQHILRIHSNDERDLRTKISGLYRKNIDVINIVSDITIDANILEKVVSSIRGLEVNELSNKHAQVICVEKIEDSQIIPEVMRLMHMTNQLFEEGTKKGNKEIAQSFAHLAIKQRDFLLRIIEKSNHEWKFELHHVVFNLEKVAGLYARITDKKTHKYLEENHVFLQQALSMFGKQKELNKLSLEFREHMIKQTNNLPKASLDQMLYANRIRHHISTIIARLQVVLG